MLYLHTLNSIIAQQTLYYPIAQLVATGGGGGKAFDFPSDVFEVIEVLDLWKLYYYDPDTQLWTPYTGEWAQQHKFAWRHLAVAVEHILDGDPPIPVRTRMARSGIFTKPAPDPPPDPPPEPRPALPLYVLLGGELGYDPTTDPDFVNVQYGYWLNNDTALFLPVQRFRLWDLQICVNDEPVTVTIQVPHYDIQAVPLL